MVVVHALNSQSDTIVCPCKYAVGLPLQTAIHTHRFVTPLHTPSCLLLGLFCVISTFCSIQMTQNMELTWKIPNSAWYLNIWKPMFWLDISYISEVNDTYRLIKYMGACLLKHVLLISAIRYYKTVLSQARSQINM